MQHRPNQAPFVNFILLYSSPYASMTRQHRPGVLQTFRSGLFVLLLFVFLAPGFSRAKEARLLAEPRPRLQNSLLLFSARSPSYAAVPSAPRGKHQSHPSSQSSPGTARVPECEQGDSRLHTHEPGNSHTQTPGDPAEGGVPAARAQARLARSTHSPPSDYSAILPLVPSPSAFARRRANPLVNKSRR